MPNFLANAQIYEEKRQRYLNAKRDSKTVEPTVNFQAAGTGNVSSGSQPIVITTPEVGSGSSERQENALGDDYDPWPGTVDNSREFRTSSRQILPQGNVSSTGILRQRPAHEAKNKLRKAQPDEHSRGNDRAAVRQEQRHLNYLLGDTTTNLVDSTPGRSDPSGERDDKDEGPGIQPAIEAKIVPDLKAEYAQQLREQIATDAAAAQRARDDMRRPVGAVAGYGGANGKGRPGAADGTGGDAIDRKAEYARKLREQMAFDKAAKLAAEKDGKRIASHDLPRQGVELAGGTNLSEDDGGTANAKAEYAQQLREQMAASETARRAEVQQNRPPLGSAEPPWLAEVARREKRRRNSNVEYGEQLRSQMIQKSGLERSGMSTRNAPGNDDPVLSQRQHRTLPQDPGRATSSTRADWSVGHERYQSRAQDDERRQIENAPRYNERGEAASLGRTDGLDYFALER